LSINLKASIKEYNVKTIEGACLSIANLNASRGMKTWNMKLYTYLKINGRVL